MIVLYDKTCVTELTVIRYIYCISGAVIGMKMKIKVKGNMRESQIKELVLTQVSKNII